VYLIFAKPCSIYIFSISEMSVAVFFHAAKVVEGKVVKGMLMYPTNFGSFKTSEDAEVFKNLFQAKAPPVPYGEIGKRYGPEKFALKEVQCAVKEHMQKHFSLPKDLDAYWELDGQMHDNLVFHPSVLYGTADVCESIDEAAIRLIWEWTGMRVDAKELLKGFAVPQMLTPVSAESEVREDFPVHIYHVNVSIQRAKWEWITHQAEKRTLTDWHVSPYKSVLGELGIPDVIFGAYCKTHGGPRFIASMDDVKDAFTQRLMADAGVEI